VVAFEPGSEARSLLAANLTANGVTVTVRPEALWTSTEDRMFSVAPQGLAYAYVAQPAADGARIRCVALDDLIDTRDLDVGRLTVVKLDIEGAEPQALAGMRRSIRHFEPTLLLEVNSHCLKRLGNSVGDLWDALEDLGYELEVLCEPHQEALFADLPTRSVAHGLGPLRRLLSKSDYVDRITAADEAVFAPSDVIQVVASPRTRLI
jgi:FkbM family methyltransferase